MQNLPKLFTRKERIPIGNTNNTLVIVFRAEGLNDTLIGTLCIYRIYSIKNPTSNKLPPWWPQKLISVLPRTSVHPDGHKS